MSPLPKPRIALPLVLAALLGCGRVGYDVSSGDAASDPGSGSAEAGGDHASSRDALSDAWAPGPLDGTGADGRSADSATGAPDGPPQDQPADSTVAPDAATDSADVPVVPDTVVARDTVTDGSDAAVVPDATAAQDTATDAVDTGSDARVLDAIGLDEAAASEAGGDVAPRDTATDGVFTCSGTGACTGIRLQYMPRASDKPDDVWVRPIFNLINETGLSVPLSRVTIRYWYTEEAPTSQTLSCDVAFMGCANIVGTFEPVSPARTGADEVVTVSFLPATAALAPGAQGTFNLRFQKDDYSIYDESSDYSYAGVGQLTDQPRVTLYFDGVLVWGVEPP